MEDALEDFVVDEEPSVSHQECQQLERDIGIQHESECTRYSRTSVENFHKQY